MAIKLYYNKTTYQLITIDDNNESLVKGDDGSKSFEFYFGTGTELADFVLDTTIPLTYEGRVTFKRADDETTNDVYLTPIAGGFYRYVIGDWVTGVEGELKITTRLKLGAAVTNFGIATIPVEDGVAPDDGSTISQLQYDAIMGTVNDVIIGTTPIAYDNTVSGLAAVDVQGAIDEVDADVDALTVRVTTAETDIDLLEGRATVLETFKDTTVPATYETKTDATSKLALKVDKTTKIANVAIDNGISLDELKTAIGLATTSISGLMSPTDKGYLNELYALLDTDDADVLVNTLGEILALFENYPEGVDLVTALAGKIDKVLTAYDTLTGESVVGTEFIYVDAGGTAKKMTLAELFEASNSSPNAQNKLVAGANITIDPITNVISASGGGGGGNSNEPDGVTIVLNENDELEVSTAVLNDIALKVNTSDIVNNLTSTDTNRPLSANQGKVLKDLVDTKSDDNAVVKLSGNQSITGTKNFTGTLQFGGKNVATLDDITSVFKYKGSVASYANLPSTGQVIGDVWNVLDTGKNFAWDGTVWDDLSGIVDLSNYYTKSETNSLFDDKVNKNTNITGATKTKITYDSKGLVTAGADLVEADIPALSASKITQTASARFVTDTEKTTWNGKVDKVTGKGLSTEDYTSDEKNKLAGIASGAEVNVQSDWNATSGDAFILNKPAIPAKVSDLTNDTGYITGYTETDPIFTAWNKSTGISITKSQVSDLIEATQALSGLMSATDKTRLDVLHALLEEDTSNSVVDSINEVLAIFNNYPEGADLVTALAGKVDKVTDKGLSTNDFTNNDKNKLDGIEVGAEVNPYSKTQLDNMLDDKVDKNANITAGTHPKITYDAKGLVTGGEALVATDIPNLNASKINAGEFDAARIPSLAASKIGSGTFDAARIPNLSPTKITQNASNRFVTDVEKAYWDGKQDKLVAGTNITIDENTNTISASGGGGEVDLNEMAYFDYAGDIYGAKYSLLANAWESSLAVDPLEISEDSDYESPRGTAQYPNGETEGVIIPQGVTSIGGQAFSSWQSNNQPLVIPNSVTSIGTYAFNGWMSNNQPLVIPNSVMSIGGQAFSSWMSNNQPLVIPNSVMSIGGQAFSSWQSNNQPLVIPNSVTSIGTYAFSSWWSNNQPLVIPNSVTSIGTYAFSSWLLVPYVEIQAVTPPTLGDSSAFGNQNDAPIYVPDESVDDYKKATNWVSLKDRIFPISDMSGAKFTDTITTINGKTGTITKADIVALGIPAQDTVYTHPTGTNPHGTTKSDVGLGNVTNDKQMPISGGVLENYTEKLTTVNESGGSIDLSLGNVFQHTPLFSTLYTITNAVNGQAHSFTLIINMESYVRTLTFPASVKWQGGEIPDMTTDNKTYVLTFMTVDGGTTWLGMFGGEF